MDKLYTKCKKRRFYRIFDLELIYISAILIALMEYVLQSDVYQIKLASLVSNVDKDVMVELYQPLVGANATILYLTLLKQKRNEEDEIEYDLTHLLNILQFTPAQFLSARRMLEGVGLLRSYCNDVRQYIYVLYAPKNPKDFFDDVLFKGLLIQSIGEKETKKLAYRYKVNLTINPEYEEVSASFVDIFHPNYDDAAFKKNFKESFVGHDEGRIRINFNDDLFTKYLSEALSIRDLTVGKRDLKEIARYSTLFGFSEKQMASVVANVYNVNDTVKIDFAKLALRAEEELRTSKPVVPENVSVMKSNDPIAQKCRLMESTPPAKYLQLKQNNTKVSRSDLAIVDSLTKNYGFSHGVINAIIDYALEKCDNTLNLNYCEKVASSLARENVKSAIDAMNYLNRKGGRKKVVEEVKEQPKVEKKTRKQISDDEMNDLLADLDSQKNRRKVR